MDGAPGYLMIPLTLQREIDDVLSTLPNIRGKLTIELVLNCGAPGVVGSLKIRKSFEVEVRP